VSGIGKDTPPAPSQEEFLKNLTALPLKRGIFKELNSPAPLTPPTGRGFSA